MQEYEEIAVQFYEDEEVLRAVAENVTGVEGSDVFRQNRHIVESKLYHMGHGKKYIKKYPDGICWKAVPYGGRKWIPTGRDH